MKNYGYTAGRRKRARKDFWLKILLAGTVMYIATLKVLQYTGNPHLVTTLVFVGNFLVPVSLYRSSMSGGYIQRKHDSHRFMLYLRGILGTITAALIEPFFITSLTFSSSFIVGFIEELAKIIV